MSAALAASFKSGFGNLPGADWGQPDTNSGQFFYLGPLNGHIESNFFLMRGVLHLPEVFDQSACIDADRAYIGAGTIDGAGLDAVVFILVLQLSQQPRPFGLS